MTRLQVLDRGYVELVDHMGDDLSVANAARASFAKRSDEFDAADERLVKFLAREGHWSPFRHASITFEVKAPLMVARQIWKYVVGSDHTQDGWNEASRRYITMEPEFYIPDTDRWRSAPENKKQGSGAALGQFQGELLSAMLQDGIEEGYKRYQYALEMGVAPEQARVFLPAYAMYTNWWWTASLQSVMHFLQQRLADDAQWETKQFASAIHELVEPLFPTACSLLER